MTGAARGVKLSPIDDEIIKQATGGLRFWRKIRGSCFERKSRWMDKESRLSQRETRRQQKWASFRHGWQSHMLQLFVFFKGEKYI